MNALDCPVRPESRNGHATEALLRRRAGAATSLSLLLLTAGVVLFAGEAAGVRAEGSAKAATAAPSAPPPSRPAAAGKEASPPDYSIRAIRYATVPGFPLEGLMRGAPKDARIDIAMVVWLVEGGGHTVLFDSGFHRDRWFKDFDIKDFLRPDEAVALAGAPAARVTDVVISHAHWDHVGGVDLFPQAQVWIQKQEYAYYTGDAWQPGGHNSGIDPDDVAVLLRLNTEGRLHLVDGDDVEILPGLRVYTGARHTFASQYLRVATGAGSFVLASDNCYLDRNLREGVASATFSEADVPGNLAAQKRMLSLAGTPDRVIPGHDPRQFERFPSEGRVARIH
ncbi:MAG TPA: N-acyl homoserine lactonase family protein [Candidatus Polarisedimenticolia bacterium]|jgi:glyoxylase-like metal-dependent hydrolase (beta-lactamase superfamily II)|nr:N-acyl homoserine lactonase family protein [Candidatus Polarisedimenticolia bacterium]